MIVVSSFVLCVGTRLWASAAASTEDQKPSFLFLLVDDIGWADFSYNNGTAWTPHIDALAHRKGTVRFQDFHSGGTVCSPTRASVLTGRNHFRDCVDYVYGCSDMSECVPHFEFAPSKTFTVGDAIRKAGNPYDDDATFFAGKWHLGSFYNDSESLGGSTSSPLNHGFSRMNATVEVAPTSTLNCACRPEWLKDCHFGHYNHSVHCLPHRDDCCFNYWWEDPRSPHGVTNLTWPSPEDDALYLVDTFERFLYKRKETGNKPWLAQISFHNCHIPFIGTEKAKEDCRRNATCKPPEDGTPPYSDKELDYYACMSQLDAAVGKILRSLEASGYYDNTMVWFTSDNGPEQNCMPSGYCQGATYRPREGPGTAGPLRGRKRDIWEGGHRVAGLVSFPALVNGNFESWETVTTMDFMPTIMELLRVERPTEQSKWALDGRSIVPLLVDENYAWDDSEEGPRTIGIGYYDPKLSLVNGWGLRYGRFKYVEGSTSCNETSCQKPQLFDLKTDLGERRDLSRKFPHILKKLKNKFYNWHASVMNSRRRESKCKKVHNLLLPKSFRESEARETH